MISGSLTETFTRDFNESDFAAVKNIYQQGIDTGQATFQQQAKPWGEWNNSVLPKCRLVAVANDNVVGWAALSTVSVRSVYAGVAEVSVYVAPDHGGQGIGSLLMAALVKNSESLGIWTLQSSVFPENKASIALHLSHGFRQLGVREKIAQHQGVWRDTVILERRSGVVGVSR